jgi:hypothetical protein
VRINNGERPPALKLTDRDRETVVEPGLDLFDNNGAFFTNFYATFASETFFGVDRHRLAILHLEYFDGTDVHALFTASALINIDDRIKRHY